MTQRRWIFLRHGQSTANAARVFSGHQDVALTELGREQARLAGTKLPDLLGGTPIDQVLVSSLQRATETAEIALRASSLDHPIPIFSKALWERTLGQWQGRDIDQLKASGDRAVLLNWHGRAPGGESLFDLATRVVPCLAQHETTKTTLVVCHGGVIRVAVGLADKRALTDLGTWTPLNAELIVRDLPDDHWSSMAIPR